MSRTCWCSVGVESLVLREVSVEGLREARNTRSDLLYGLEWVEVPGVPAVDGVGGVGDGWVVLGAVDGVLAGCVAGVGVFDGVGALSGAVDGGLDVPVVVLVDCVSCVEGGDSVVGGVRDSVLYVLELLQGWLADERFVDSQLVMVTRGAVATGAGEDVCDLPGASVWGLVRSAQSENPREAGAG